MENSLAEVPEILETLIDNTVQVRLCDTAGRRYYLDTKCDLNVILCFNAQDWQIGALPTQYNLAKRLEKVKNMGSYTQRHKAMDQTQINALPHLFSPASLTKGDNSLLEMLCAPDKEAKEIYLHVFVQAGATVVECKNSPVKVSVEKSDLHRQRDLQKALSDEQQRALEEANRLKKLALEEEKRRKKQLLDEAIAQKQAARKKAREEAERKAKEEEEDRRLRKELRQGGGFNMAKYNEMKAQQKK